MLVTDNSLLKVHFSLQRLDVAGANSKLKTEVHVSGYTNLGKQTH